METIIKLFGAICLIVGIAIVLTIPVYFLWNDVVVDVFKAPVLDFWQALKLSILCSLLIKSGK
jgi:hypothetical protein